MLSFRFANPFLWVRRLFAEPRGHQSSRDHRPNPTSRSKMGYGNSDANTMPHRQPGNSYRLNQLRMEMNRGSEPRFCELDAHILTVGTLWASTMSILGSRARERTCQMTE